METHKTDVFKGLNLDIKGISSSQTVTLSPNRCDLTHLLAHSFHVTIPTQLFLLLQFLLFLSPQCCILSPTLLLSRQPVSVVATLHLLIFFFIFERELAGQQTLTCRSAPVSSCCLTRSCCLISKIISSLDCAGTCSPSCMVSCCAVLCSVV